MISENTQDEILETFRSMKIDAECNENVPARSIGRFHNDLSFLLKISSNVVSVVSEIIELEQNQVQIWNQRLLKRWRPL